MPRLHRAPRLVPPLHGASNVRLSVVSACAPALQTHYFSSHPRLNYYSVIPKGDDDDDRPWWEQPTDRPKRFEGAGEQ